MMKNKFFYVSHGKELFDNLSLIEMIKQARVAENGAVLINCMPDYSSILTQLVNHKLCYLNKDDLFEMINLEIPFDDMSQVWDREGKEYRFFDWYLSEWSKKHLIQGQTYIFLSSFVNSGKYYNKIRSVAKNYDSYFASTYVEKDSNWSPEFHVEHFEKPILFEWQNSNKI